MTRLCLSLLACLFLSGSASASDTYAFHVTVDRDSITVGDPFVVTLALEHESSATLAILPDVRLPETFRVQGMSDAVHREIGDGRTLWTQSIRLTSFRPGETEIPVIRVNVSAAPGDTTRLSDDPIPILVQSVKPDSLSDILDVKRPVSIDAVVPAWVWAAVGLLVIGLFACFLWWRKRSRETDETPVFVPVDWFEEVRKIRRSKLIESGDFDTYYTRLSEALRRFIEQRTGVEAMERTTFEIRRDLADSVLAGTGVLDVERVLNGADLVKFAKFEPNAARAEADCDEILELMGRIDKAFKPTDTIEAEPGDQDLEAAHDPAR